MGEALAYLSDWVGAGSAEAGAATEGATEAVASPSPSNVTVENADTGEKQQRKKSKGVARVIDNGGKVLGASVPDLDSFPTGGVSLLIFLALFVVFAITTAPGQSMTRLQLLWASIMGNATLGDSTGGTTVSTPSFGYTVSVPGQASGNYHPAYPGGPLMLGH